MVQVLASSSNDSYQLFVTDLSGCITDINRECRCHGSRHWTQSVERPKLRLSDWQQHQQEVHQPYWDTKVASEMDVLSSPYYISPSINDRGWMCQGWNGYKAIRKQCQGIVWSSLRR